MKKSLIIFGICGLTALTGCQNNAATEDIYEESGNTINVNDQRADLYNKGGGMANKSEDFGYVRHQKSPVLGDKMSNDHYAALDREQLADIISKYCTDVPNVDDVSSLVTDEEVLIVYDTDTDNPDFTANQVEKMALSVVPRFYHVYVSDNTNLRKNIESYATLDSDSGNAKFGIDKLIKEMQKSRQGTNNDGDPQEETTNENNL